MGRRRCSRWVASLHVADGLRPGRSRCSTVGRCRRKIPSQAFRSVRRRGRSGAVRARCRVDVASCGCFRSLRSLAASSVPPGPNATACTASGCPPRDPRPVSDRSSRGAPLTLHSWTSPACPVTASCAPSGDHASRAGSTPARSSEDFPMPEGPTMPMSDDSAARATRSEIAVSRPLKYSASERSNDARPLNGQTPSSTASARAAAAGTRSSDASCSRIKRSRS